MQLKNSLLLTTPVLWNGVRDAPTCSCVYWQLVIRHSGNWKPGLLGHLGHDSQDLTSNSADMERNLGYPALATGARLEGLLKDTAAEPAGGPRWTSCDSSGGKKDSAAGCKSD